MTHDPLCPQRECDVCAWKGEGCCRGDCRCEEYAKVRSDERADALEDAHTEVTGAFLIHILDMSPDHTWSGRGLDRPTDTTAAAPCSGCEAIKQAVLALNRLRGEP